MVMRVQTLCLITSENLKCYHSYIAEVMAPDFWFAKRSINFLNIAPTFSSQNIQWKGNVGCFGTYYIMGGNIMLLVEKYDMNVKNEVKAWNERISKNYLFMRVCEQVTEVVCVGMRDW